MRKVMTNFEVVLKIFEMRKENKKLCADLRCFKSMDCIESR